MKFQLILALLVTVTAVIANDYKIPEKNERQAEQPTLGGFKTTPMHPDGKWHIHDPDRPQPPVAEPKYDGKPVSAPEGAIIIFDGKKTDALVNKNWPIKDGIMTVGKGSQKSKQAFGDMHLHVEWLVPVGLPGWEQKQGNSGIFLMGKYEIQVLNCWANRTYPDGMTGAMYGQKTPLVNACKKPGEWQAYDLHFTAPVFKDDKLVSPAKLTAFLNNVKVQDNSEFFGLSTFKRVAKYKAHPAKLPFTLQSHKNPVQFRNIWVVEK